MKVVYPCNEISFIDKTKLAIKPEKPGMNFLYTLLSEESQSEKVAYYMIPITGYSGKGKTREKLKKSVFSREMREWGKGEAWGIFRAVKLI